MSVVFLTMDTPLGRIRLEAEEGELTGVALPGEGSTPAPGAVSSPGEPVLREASRQLSEYFSGDRAVFDLPLRRRGTSFQLSVWRAMDAIPFGKTASYGAVARAIGRPAAVRAVGGASGRNPLGIVVPCHRVIGSTGRLTGYGGGLAAKQWLLAHEAKHGGRS